MAVDDRVLRFDSRHLCINDRCLEMVRVATTGCSFEFYPRTTMWSAPKGADGKDEVIIRHKSFDS